MFLANFNATSASRPSFFEMIAQQEMMPTLRPALKYALAVSIPMSYLYRYILIEIIQVYSICNNNKKIRKYLQELAHAYFCCFPSIPSNEILIHSSSLSSSPYSIQFQSIYIYIYISILPRQIVAQRQVGSTHTSNLWWWLNNHTDELFLLIQLALESHHLKHYGNQSTNKQKQ